MENSTTNLDHAEISRFDALAGDWWDPRGPLKTLHVINPVRLSYITHAVPLKSQSVLDIGCGGGVLAEAMTREGAKVTGIDPSAASIAVAKSHGQHLCIDYHACTAENFTEISDKKFDVVTCMELLEHVPSPASLLNAAASLLKPGGHLFLATINRSPVSYLAAVVAVEYLFRLLPRGTHDYAKFIRPAELCGWLRAAGFSVRDITGMGYIPGADSAFLTDSVSVNYLVHARLNDGISP